MTLRLCLACALVPVSFLSARAQDPNIDRLLRKLPPPEKMVKTELAPGVRTTDPVFQDPVAQSLMKKMATGNTSGALGEARKLASRYPRSGLAQFMHGSIALTANQPQEAAVALRQSVVLEPKLAIAHLALGVAEGAQGRFAAALPSIRKSTELDPRRAVSWMFLSACFERLGRKQESAQAAQRATALAPKAAAAWTQLARAENALGHRAEAMLAVGKAVRLSPANPTLAAVAGIGGIDIHRPADAIPILRRAAQLEPKNSLIQAQLGSFLLLAGQTDQAIVYLRKSVALNPKNGPAWRELGMAYQSFFFRGNSSGQSQQSEYH